jgi:hypothetical protein
MMMMMKSSCPLPVFPFSPPFCLFKSFGWFFVSSHVLPGHNARGVPAPPNRFLI